MMVAFKNDRADALANKQKKLTHSPTSLEELNQTIDGLERRIQSLLGGGDADFSLSKNEPPQRRPGRFKGKLVVGAEFFDPLTDEELKEFSPE